MNSDLNHSPTVDAAEVARFSALAATWWDTRGKMAALHKLNPVRLAYIRDATCQQFGRDPKRVGCLTGLRILDIGCGGGILSEPLARLGASVLGADPSTTNIEVAKLHAAQSGLAIDYRATTAEALCDAGERFDVVLAMEVVEHVADVDLFVQKCADMVKPGGLMVAATLNHTLKSFALDLTRNPAAFISAMRRLGAQNLAEEHPSRLVQWLFYSHPPLNERIAAAREFKAL